MNDLVKSITVAGISAVSVGLIGYGSVVTEMDNINRQEIENKEVNNSFYTVRADVIQMKSDNLNIHRDIVRLTDRVRKTEIASAETVKVLNGVTIALEKQTEATSKLMEQVIRLEVMSGSKQ